MQHTTPWGKILDLLQTTQETDALSKNKRQSPARQNDDFGRNFTYLLPIFHLFSAYGTPFAVFPHTCLQNLPISIYFPPIFCLKWYPINVINEAHGTHLLFFRPHVYGLCLFSTYIPQIFHLTFSPYSAGPVLPGWTFAVRGSLFYEPLKGEG